MKYLYEKNRKFILNFLKSEYTQYKLKILIYNTYLSKDMRSYLFNILYYKYKIKKNTKIKIKNRCYLHKNSNSFNKKFLLGRYALRKYCFHGLISGLRKHSF